MAAVEKDPEHPAKKRLTVGRLFKEIFNWYPSEYPKEERRYDRVDAVMSMPVPESVPNVRSEDSCVVVVAPEVKVLPLARVDVRVMPSYVGSTVVGTELRD